MDGDITMKPQWLLFANTATGLKQCERMTISKILNPLTYDHPRLLLHTIRQIHIQLQAAEAVKQNLKSPNSCFVPMSDI
jgi:hypothetical protein